MIIIKRFGDNAQLIMMKSCLLISFETEQYTMPCVNIFHVT